MSIRAQTTARPPSVERVLAIVRAADPHADPVALAAVVRAVVDEERGRLTDGVVARDATVLAQESCVRVAAFAALGVEPVINATGVIVHTNLGRAPWPDGVAAAAADLVSGYALLELDRRTGRRGPRARVAEDHLVVLTGGDDAIVTNNNAAAVALVVGLAGRGGVVVSRGELVEIGGGVRIPEIVRRAGAKLVEVGTTNRTRASDYEAPLAEGRARAVLRVHPSNFSMHGFTEAPDAAEVAAIAHRHGAIVIDDLGSGALLDTAAYGLAHEPMPGERLTAGADLVTFSGDKLVGGPQAGFIVGRADLDRTDPSGPAGAGDAARQADDGRRGAHAGPVPRWSSDDRDPGVADDRRDRSLAPRPRRQARRPDRGARRGHPVRLDRRRRVAPRRDPGLVGRGPPGTIGGSGTRGAPTRGADRDRAHRGRPRGAGPADRRAGIGRGPARGRGAGARRYGMTVVVGTAGHIDHGKTTLLRALTGIDADRLPEERRRGMTIDVGYAHLAFDDGSELDFVDVPGHDRLVGNMLVGAGEIDAAMLVVAADDGIRAQTREHLALLDALAVAPGIAVVTKIDAVEPGRVTAVVADVVRLLAGTSLAGSPVQVASAVTGEGIAEVRLALERLRDAALARSGRPRDARLAVDRVFGVKGRGVVVTGTLRGGEIALGTVLRVVPGDGRARVRGIQVHGRDVDPAPPGRTALNLAGIDGDGLRRGFVLTADADVVATSRILVRLWRPLPDRTRGRLHLGTAAVDGAVSRSGRDAIDLEDGTVAGVLRLVEPIAIAPGDRFVLRRSGGADTIVGGVVLDAVPPRGVSRRRQTVDRVRALARAVQADDRDDAVAARLDIHGLVADDGRAVLADDVRSAAEACATDAVSTGATDSTVRVEVARAIRRVATGTREQAAAAAAAMVEELVTSGRLERDGDRLRRPGAVAPAPDPMLDAAKARLETALGVVAPPSLAEAARAAGCPPAGIRDLERAGRIVVLEPDLAYAMPMYRDLAARALAMAAASPLTPAAYRDAIGGSRKYVMAHPRGPRSAGDPASDAGRSRPRTEGPRPDGAVVTIAAIVLAGGRSTRFGRDKLAEPIDGRPMLELAIDAVRVVAGEVLVVVAPDAVPALPDGTRLVHDLHSFEGPLAGVAAGLAATEADAVLVVGGDMPRMVPAVLRRMLAALAAGPTGAADIVLLESLGERRPLPMAIRTTTARLAADALLASGERRLRALGTHPMLSVIVIPESTWRLDDPTGETLRDVDTEASLRAILGDQPSQSSVDS